MNLRLPVRAPAVEPTADTATRTVRAARRRYPAALAGALALGLALTACGGGEADTSEGEMPAASVEGAADRDRGTVLDTPFAKPDIVLTDTDGEPYDLRAETEGTATLLYFGYTHCPDICPLTMSNIAVGARDLTEEQRENLRVVMITSDPERDTPGSLGEWLRGQDPEFIGLTGDFAEIREAARGLGVYIEEPYEDEDGGIVSSHGTQVIAFLPDDDMGRVLYTEGVTHETFERDLPKLIAGDLP
ncbi:SCO family protein [Streptomyces sp. ST2-7A]|uniref:SCO family protein n=1 Tax=Streptomyces sp. ST2-7A TaxID=2907214 RepID=UPI001F30855E|nr:SCO family protein [Streptomyces sp. ST2-7A]MCE7083391.1 SCO family protein [Streptomyces sp. ST2-7A]